MYSFEQHISQYSNLNEYTFSMCEYIHDDFSDYYTGIIKANNYTFMITFDEGLKCIVQKDKITDGYGLNNIALYLYNMAIELESK